MRFCVLYTIICGMRISTVLLDIEESFRELGTWGGETSFHSLFKHMFKIQETAYLVHRLWDLLGKVCFAHV